MPVKTRSGTRVAVSLVSVTREMKSAADAIACVSETVVTNITHTTKCVATLSGAISTLSDVSLMHTDDIREVKALLTGLIENQKTMLKIITQHETDIQQLHSKSNDLLQQQQQSASK